MSSVDGVYFITAGEFEVSQVSQINFEQQASGKIKYKSQKKIQMGIVTRSQMINANPSFVKPKLP